MPQPRSVCDNSGKVSCVPGAMYTFQGQPGPNRPDGSRTWIVEPGQYRCVGIGKNVRTWQEMVAYVGAGGVDHGKMFFCTLADWSEHFRVVSIPQTEKTINLVREGNEGRG